MIRLSDGEVRIIRLKVSQLDDWRCQDVDDQGCRCLRRRDHAGEHDHSYTPHTRALGTMKVERTEKPIVVMTGSGLPTRALDGRTQCGSSMRSYRCCYASGHNGYHCNYSGTLTWETDTPGATP